MTLLERFYKMVDDAWVIGRKEELDEIRRALAIAQAVEEYGKGENKHLEDGFEAWEWIVDRADELLKEGKK